MIIHIFILNSVESYESTRPHDDSALLEKLEILAAEYENDEKTEIVPKVLPERFQFLPMTLPEPKTIFQDLRVSNPDAPKGIFISTYIGGAASPPHSKSPQDTEITCKMRKSPHAASPPTFPIL